MDGPISVPDEHSQTVFLPYVKGTIHRTASLLKKHGIETTFKTLKDNTVGETTIRLLLMTCVCCMNVYNSS